MFQRGFKAEASRLASEIRSELGLSLFDPLESTLLAEYLEIPILPLTKLSGLCTGADHFLSTSQDVFSAATVFHGAKRMIVHNDSHVLVRQNSNLAHELAHALLHHEATPALDDKGCRNWDNQIEKEAEWLAGTLLVPEKAAVGVARGRWGDLVSAANYFGVSESMLRYRLNVTAAYKRASSNVTY